LRTNLVQGLFSSRYGLIIKRGFLSDLSVGNALIVMYAKCGNIAQAWEVFNELSKADVVSWNSMIAGYAQTWLWEGGT